MMKSTFGVELSIASNAEIFMLMWSQETRVLRCTVHETNLNNVHMLKKEQFQGLCCVYPAWKYFSEHYTSYDLQMLWDLWQYCHNFATSGVNTTQSGELFPWNSKNYSLHNIHLVKNSLRLWKHLVTIFCVIGVHLPTPRELLASVQCHLRSSTVLKVYKHYSNSTNVEWHEHHIRP